MNKEDKKNQSHKAMNSMTAISIAAMFLFIVCYQIFHSGAFLSLAITFGTISYHLVMRLLVGFGTLILKKRDLDYNGKWFSPKKVESGIYQKLGVKRWKGKMPTYNPSTFSIKEHSLEEVIQTMCISEISHELNVVLSFVPLSFALIWGEFPVFLITSIVGGLIDMPFVIMQRYNRPRLVRMLEKRKGTVSLEKIKR